MNAKFTFTPQNDFIEFIDSFGYDDDRLNELKEKIKSNSGVYTNSYYSPNDMRNDLTKVLTERGENHYKIKSEIMEILRSKNPPLFFEKYLDYLNR